MGFDDERFISISPENFDELLQAYREMYPETSHKDVYMFSMKYNSYRDGNSSCNECTRTIASTSL